MLNIESSSLHLNLWDIEQLLQPVEQPLAHQHHVALLVLGVHVDVDTNKDEQPAKTRKVSARGVYSKDGGVKCFKTMKCHINTYWHQNNNTTLAAQGALAYKLHCR